MDFGSIVRRVRFPFRVIDTLQLIDDLRELPPAWRRKRLAVGFEQAVVKHFDAKARLAEPIRRHELRAVRRAVQIHKRIAPGYGSAG